jgi:single-strand DNA-binding protein
MSKATISVEGFVTKDPETRQAAGKNVIAVDIAHTPRKKDGNDWVDAGDTIWFQASFWDRDVDAIAASVRKGTLVTVTGQPELNVYQKNDGTAGVSVRIKFGTLGIIPRGDAQQGRTTSSTAPAPSWDSAPTSKPQAGAQGDAWAPAGSYNDETPF